MRIMLKDVRLAFPSLWKATAPKGPNGGEPAFSAAFLFPPNHTSVVDGKKVKTTEWLEKVFEAVAAEKWGAKAKAINNALKAADKRCLHNGDSKSEYEGFEGNMFVSARSKVRPNVFNQQREPLLVEADGKPYSGCYVNASIEIWPQENGFGKRLNAQLRGVQFLRDGDAFAGGSRPADADEFDEISAEDAGDAPEESEEEDLTA